MSWNHMKRPLQVCVILWIDYIWFLSWYGSFAFWVTGQKFTDSPARRWDPCEELHHTKNTQVSIPGTLSCVYSFTNILHLSYQFIKCLFIMKSFYNQRCKLDWKCLFSSNSKFATAWNRIQQYGVDFNGAISTPGVVALWHFLVTCVAGVHDRWNFYCLRKMCGPGVIRIVEEAPLYDILNEFQKGHSHMAVVVKYKKEKANLTQQGPDLKLDWKFGHQKHSKWINESKPLKSRSSYLLGMCSWSKAFSSFFRDPQNFLLPSSLDDAPFRETHHLFMLVPMKMQLQKFLNRNTFMMAS